MAKVDLRRLSPLDVAKYEIYSSPIAPWIRWGWAQKLAGDYYAWKAKRKLRRYDRWRRMNDAQG